MPLYVFFTLFNGNQHYYLWWLFDYDFRCFQLNIKKKSNQPAEAEKYKIDSLHDCISFFINGNSWFIVKKAYIINMFPHKSLQQQQSP